MDQPPVGTGCHAGCAPKVATFLWLLGFARLTMAIVPSAVDLHTPLGCMTATAWLSERHATWHALTGRTCEAFGVARRSWGSLGVAAVFVGDE